MARATKHSEYDRSLTEAEAKACIDTVVADRFIKPMKVVYQAEYLKA